MKIFRMPKKQKRSKISKMHSILQEKYWSRKSVNVLILDEVLGLVEAGVIEAEELRALFEAKGEYTSLILTGIYPAKEIWQYADEVTEMVTAYKADSSGQ